MQFTPKTKKEIDSLGLMPEGVYPFTIAKAENKVSKKGNEMISLTLNVIDSHSKSWVIYDYLLELIAEKLYNAAHVCGLKDKYVAGALDASDFENCQGMVKVAIERDNRDKNRNVIRDYVFPVGSENPKDLNDEVPF